MSDLIRNFDYSKRVGRGRGILALSNSNLCRPPGLKSNLSTPSEDSCSKSDDVESKILITMHSYSANPDCPGGFPELSVTKGELLTLVKEHQDNEHWWEVKNEDGETGFVPSSYVIIKDDQVLPWLQLSCLKQEEEERKERVKRLDQQKSAAEGVGSGPLPTTLSPKPYVSSYAKEQSGVAFPNDPDRFYCKVCDKRLNGPKPFGAHMASKAHKEELALLKDM